MFLLLSKDFEAILKGSSFCNFGSVLYKTKTLAKYVENRKYYCSPLLLQARIMLDLFSSDFKTKRSSFLGLRSSGFVLYTPFKGKIIFHFGNLRSASARIKQFQKYGGRRRRWSHVRPSSFHYCVYAVGSHPTEEPISTKATIAYNQKQQENNSGVLLSVTEEISYKENRLGF